MDLTRSEWIDLTVAGATLLLAAATFAVAYYSRRTAADSAKALHAFEQQAKAATAAAETAQKAVTAQVDASTRQMRVHMAWIQTGDQDFDVATDPGDWKLPEGQQGKPAIEIRCRIKNLSAVAAYIGSVDLPVSVSTVIVDDPYVAPGGEGKVTLYVPIEPGQELGLTLEPLVLHFYSMASGEPGEAEGVLTGTISIAKPPSTLITFKDWVPNGWLDVQPSTHPPKGIAAKKT